MPIISQLVHQLQQIQSTSHNWSQALRVTVRFTWWVMEMSPLKRLPQRSRVGLRKKLLGQSIWSGMLKVERGTTACRMTLGHLIMSLGMMLPQGDTTQSSTHGIGQTETDSETGHDPSERKSVGSSTKESTSTIPQLTMPWPQACSSTNSPPLS
jgi:hypothetical protein